LSPDRRIFGGGFLAIEIPQVSEMLNLVKKSPEFRSKKQ
jgi:hypothetical protein